MLGMRPCEREVGVVVGCPRLEDSCTYRTTSKNTIFKENVIV